MLAHTSGRKPHPIQPQAACNLIPAFINCVPTSCLIDNGATIGMISNALFQKLVKLHRINPTGTQPVAKPERRRLVSADGSPLQVIASVDVDIKLNGVIVPFNLIIVNDIVDPLFPVILCMSFLSATRAVVDVFTHRL